MNFNENISLIFILFIEGKLLPNICVFDYLRFRVGGNWSLLLSFLYPLLILLLESPYTLHTVLLHRGVLSSLSPVTPGDGGSL